MCGRYYYDQDTEEYVKSLIGYDMEVPSAAAGDIVPSMKALVVAGKNNRLVPEMMNWGFPFGEVRQPGPSGGRQYGTSGGGQPDPSRSSSRLLINARAETALEKQTFSDSILNRRCVLPAKWFYEWDRDHNKAIFSLDGHRTIWLAGFYNYLENSNRYVILTTAANESMIRTHDRMPLMIDERDIKDWIFDDSSVKDFLKAGQPQLSKRQDYEQLRFF